MKKNKRHLQLDGAMGRYLRWPLYISVLLVLLDICILLFYREAFVFTFIFTVIVVALCLVQFAFKRYEVVEELVGFATEYNHSQHVMLKELDVPFGIMDLNGKIVWGNNELKDLIGGDKVLRYSFTELFGEDTLPAIPSVEEDVESHIIYKDRNYCVKLRLVTPSNYGNNILWHEESEDTDAPDDALVAIFFYDETDNIALRLENFDEKMLVGLLYIDNFEEAFEGADEVRRSLVTAWVEREINKYLKDYDAILKRLEKDKYIFVFKQKYLAKFEEDRFSILESIRNLNIYDLTITISIGVGVSTDSYVKCSELARVAMDMALGRGGDQAVVKTTDKIRYYGGVSASQEKSTRVKARVKAQSLKEYIETHEKTVVMGHSNPDSDCVGAAIGIYRIAKSLDKRAYIVLTDENPSVKPILDVFRASSEYEEDMFITGAKAKSIVDNDTLLVVVDVNRPVLTDTKELLDQTKTLVVLDHHRQMDDHIENAVLSYVEPYASSTCEMVAEILQYVSDELKLRPAEADAMYGGMMIDTNNFLMKTGVRTFEAAAFLRRNGADVTKIRKLFRSDFAEYQARANAISNAEVYMKNFAFAVFDGAGLPNPTVTAAQTANEMLSIDGVKGAFVFTELNGRVHLSARSIDELNVQLVCEKVGGGGHMSAAGAQFEGITTKEAVERVKEALDRMIENKEIK